jgi:hypothetical protein
MTKTFLIIGAAASLLAAKNIHAQQNTQGWPIVPQYVNAMPTPPFQGVVGAATSLNGVTLAPASTNTYTPGTANQVYISTADSDYIGLQFASLVPTNSASTNLPGNITVRLAHSVDGITAAESTPPIVLVLNSANNTYSGTNIPPPASLFTNLYVPNCIGLFVMSLESTNWGANGPTNIVTVKVLNKPSAVNPTVTPATQYNQ